MSSRHAVTTSVVSTARSWCPRRSGTALGRVRTVKGSATHWDGWLSSIHRNITRRVTPRQRAAFRTLWEHAINGVPDRLFLAARRRYGRRLEESHSAPLPVLLRMATFRRRIPSSVQAFELLGRPDLKMSNVESIATRVVFWTGDHWVSQHGAGMKIWEALCRRAAKIVELGANVGYYTIAGGAVATGAYSAYEPHPRSCAALRRNLELNGIDRVLVVEAAAVPEPTPTHVELVCPTGTDRGAPSGAMVKGSPFEGDDPDRETESVVVNAVAFAAAIDGSDLVKIDVEGLEAQLLVGAWAQLCAEKPAVMVEIHDHNKDLRSLLPRLMLDLDAVAYAMRRDYLVPVGPDVLEDGSLFDTCHTWDYLIVPAGRASLVDGLVRA